MKVLIVEDEATDRLMLRSAVQHLGHECLVACSGLQGWEMFGTHEPDVVISDWRMPGVDGSSCVVASEPANGRRTRRSSSLPA